MRILAAAALLLLVVSLAATPRSNASESWERKRSEEETRRIFAEWKAKHGTADSSLGEEDEERAYAMFNHCLRHIDQRWHDDGHSVSPWERERSEAESRQLFAEWKARHGKAYSSTAHEEHRYTIFKEAHRDMDRHNAGYAIGVHHNMQGINSFADLTTEEFEAVCCGYWKEMPSEAELQRVDDIQERLRLVYAPSSL